MLEALRPMEGGGLERMDVFEAEQALLAAAQAVAVLFKTIARTDFAQLQAPPISTAASGNVSGQTPCWSLGITRYHSRHNLSLGATTVPLPSQSYLGSSERSFCHPRAFT